MCANLLYKKSGTKKIPWRKIPVPFELSNQENDFPIESNICRLLILDRIYSRTGLFHNSNEEAPKEQIENFQVVLSLNLTNPSNMKNMERNYIISPGSGGSANLSTIRALFTNCSNYDKVNFGFCANFVENRALCNTSSH